MLEILEVVGSEVCQVPVLGVAPDPLDWIEVRGIGWQPLDNDPPTLSKPSLNLPCPMGLPPVPDERESMRQMSPQVPKKTQNLCRANVVSVVSPVQAEPPLARSECDGTDCRKPVTTVPLPKDRCLAPRCPTSPHNRLKHETALIKKDDASAGSLGVFLYGASALVAISEWRLRLVPGLAVLVSDNSSPRHAGSSRRAMGGSERQRYDL